MPGLDTLLNMGRKALFADQAAIQVVGNNISNANTEGYSRQAVRMEDGIYVNYTPGQLGTGVDAKEVVRYFDEFVEEQYNAKMSEQERWSKLYENLQNVEAVLNESNTEGINSALSDFFADWQKLSANPEDTSVRTALLGHASNLEKAIQSAGEDLKRVQDQIDDFVAEDVTGVNKILSDIAELNKQITINEETGRNNANTLRDQRSSLVRQLSEKMDINYIDNGLGNVTITTKAGQTLVDGQECFRIALESPQVITDLTNGSAYVDANGKSLQVNFEGNGSYEYTIKFITGGTIDSTWDNTDPQFNISIDGGKTWLKNEDGSTKAFSANTKEYSLTIPNSDIDISFDAGTVSAGDSFLILPKKSLFWYQTASSKVNITPQVMADGQDNDRRVVGGSLAGYVNFRDNSVGEYVEKLDALAKSLAWEVNRIHSQGAGLQKFTSVVGSYGVNVTDAGLGTATSGLLFNDKLSDSDGNVMVYVYDTNGVLVGSRELFNDANFSASNTLEEVEAEFDEIGHLNASIVDKHLQISAESGYTFAFGSDSCGLLAALGINTFFDGSDARTLAINTNVQDNIAFINSGHVNGAGEVNAGDNTMAAAIAALEKKDVDITTLADGTTSQTVSEYFSALVSKVGSDVSNSKFNYEYQAALASDLKAKQESVSGVNLDEEMTSLIKYQHAYTAAAKLITTADSMMQVLLGIKN